MRWGLNEYLPNVETRSCDVAGHQRVVAAEVSVSDVLASLCRPRFGARSGLSHFDKVSAAANGRLSRHRRGGSRFSRITPPRLRPVLAWSGRGGGDFDRQILFRRSASGLRRGRVVDRCIGLERLAASRRL